MKAITATSRTLAWRKAYSFLASCKAREAFHLVVEITDPMETSAEDEHIEKAVDKFLVQHRKLPLHSVAETIFPAKEYLQKGRKGVYAYPDDVYPYIKKVQRPWGNYVCRLLRHQLPDGTTVNPLEDVVAKIKDELSKPGPKKACYELSIADNYLELPAFRTVNDHNGRMGGPCLSHISLKIAGKEQLLLTALYRHHYYTERALGNFLGLARLQRFICDETNLTPGPLLCVSTLAKLDSANAKADALASLIKKVKVAHD